MSLRKGFTAFMAVVVAMTLVIGAAGTHLGDGDGTVELEDTPAAGTADALGVTGSLIGGIVIGSIACDTVIRDVCGDSSADSDEMNKTDALETWSEINSQLSTQAQAADNHFTTLDNYLQDTETIARIEGKNAYIKALENGSSEAAARQDAREAIDDYYSVKQMQLINQWETAVVAGTYGSQVAHNETELDAKNVSTAAGDLTLSNGGSYGETEWGVGSEEYQLINGSTRNVSLIDIYVIHDGYSNWYVTRNITVGDSQHENPSSSNNYATPRSVVALPPPGSTKEVHYVDFSEYAQRWDNITAQNTEVQNDVDYFINQTYDNWVSGSINESDLIDPYLAAREYDPDGQWGTWALRSLSSIGVQPPENLSAVGSMKIEYTENGSSTNVVWSGMLMDSGSRTYQKGATYETANLSGTQYFMDMENQVTNKLNGTFTVENITTYEGEVLDNVTYSVSTYNTTSLTEYEALMGELSNLTAQINARQAELRTGGGGGLLGGFPTLPGMGAIATIVVVFIGLMAARVVTG